MAIKRITTNAEITQYLEKRIGELRWKIIEIFKYVGEQAVNEARNNHRYANQTGNLQSSIGYCVLNKGDVIFGGRDSFKVEKNGQEGAKGGWEFLQRLISEHPTGIVLIVVAGMEYAAYVEAKNLNVLDSAEQLAEREIPRLLKDLKLNK